MTPRVAPLSPPYEPALATLLEKWMPPNSALEPLHLFRTMALHPELFSRMRPLGSALLGQGTLPARERELLINRTCAVCDCEYEWGVHVAAFGRLVGLSPEQLQATADRPLPAADSPNDIWEEGDRLLLQWVDELHQTGRVSEAVWEGLAQRWTPPQLIEGLVLIGFYHLISFVAKGLQVEKEAWAPPFPEAK